MPSISFATVSLAFDDLVTDLSNLGVADASAKDAEGIGWTNQKYPLGTERRENGKIYRYCQFKTDVTAITAGMVVYFVTSATTIPTMWKVSATLADSKVNLVAGVVLMAVTTARNLAMGWVQRGGVAANVVSNGGNTALQGDNIIGSGNGTGVRMIVGTAPTNTVLGICLATEAASLFPNVYLSLEQ